VFEGCIGLAGKKTQQTAPMPTTGMARVEREASVDQPQ